MNNLIENNKRMLSAGTVDLDDLERGLKQNKMTPFNNLLHDCGLSTKGAARLLDVRHDSVRNWKYGKCAVPDGVMSDLKLYAQSAKKIFKT